MSVQVGYSATTSERSERDNAAVRSGGRKATWRERRTKKSNIEKGGDKMFEDYYMTVEEVANALKISKSFAYKVVREMNSELKELGYFTIAGRVNKQFFLDKTCYNEAKARERR